jgi:hypothetical protein
MRLRTHGLSSILASTVLAGSALAGTLSPGQTCSLSGVPAGGIVCAVFNAGSSMTSPQTADLGPLSSSQTLLISYLSGSVNMFPAWVDFWFNPDGSLVNPNSAEDWTVDSMNYNYVRPGYEGYPTAAGGDGINHFAGGGLNYDKYPSVDSAWGFWSQNLTTDTWSSDAVRFGSLVGTLNEGLNWFYIGYGTEIGAGTAIPIPEGATLRLAVMDAYYGPNTGSFQVGISAAASDVPEPSVLLLVGAGLAAIGLMRRRRT